MIDKFAERLISAQKMAGLSMEALVQKAGSIGTKQAIGKYEKGMIKSSSGVLLALAEALDVTVDYFFRSARFEIEGIEFRKRSRLGKKEEERIKYRTIEFIQKYLEIEEILDAHPPFENPVIDTRIANYEGIERVAMQIREKWNLGIGPIPNLIELLEEKGVKIFEVDAGKRFDGLSGFVENMGIPVISIYKNSDIVRKRFTVAHEMGHLLLDFSDSNEAQPEKLCHAFAGALLLPKKVVIEELGRNRKKITEWELKKIKSIYGISMQAIMARAFHLRIISEFTCRQFNIYVNKHGWRKSEPGDYDEHEEASRFKKLVLYAAAEQIVSFSKAAELLNQPLAEFERQLRIVS